MGYTGNKVGAGVVLAFAVLMLYGVMGYMDQQDAVRYEQHACDMQQAGYWPADAAVDCKIGE